MPKKLNFLGGMQNYNAQTGEYEPALKGPNGESPSGFKSFKKPKSEFETANEKRLGKVKGEKQDLDKQKEIDYTDEEISEELADMEWAITGKETAGDYAKHVAEKMGISKDKVFAVMKKENPNITEDMKMSKIAGFDDDDLDDLDDLDEDEEEVEVEKEKTLDDYTDDLFKETNLKTFTSKKYKAKDSGDIIEVRLFGKDSAIRYNETKNIVEQVWLKGKKVK